MFVKHRCHKRQQSRNIEKIYEVRHSPSPGTCGIKVLASLNEISVHVWLLCDHKTLKYCTLYIRRKGLDRLTDRPTIGLLVWSYQVCQRLNEPCYKKGPQSSCDMTKHFAIFKR